MKNKLKVLFLCTGNSCRSQMAQGWAKALKSEQMEVWSAGLETHGLNPNAVRVMAEVGIDISDHWSKRLEDIQVEFDIVITVCGHAHETCPYFPAQSRVIHLGFDDPPKLAANLAAKGESAERQLDCYRRIRDEIRLVVEKMPDNIL